MGDQGHVASTAESVPSVSAKEDPPTDRGQNASAAFQSQLDRVSRAHPHDVGAYNQGYAFQMGAMAHSLPPTVHSPMHTRVQYGLNQPLSSQPIHEMHRALPQSWPNNRTEPMVMARGPQMQEAQYFYRPYATLLSSQQTTPHTQPQSQYGIANLQGYSSAPMGSQSVDPGLVQMAGPVTAPGMNNDFQHYIQGRPNAALAPVPSFPRGPPRKPKQSGHALWVGNLPPTATLGDLKDHFSRDAKRDIESVFHISKSNCAFVNYRTEAACIAAMNRFHDSRFYGVRLVCRLRRGSITSSGPDSSTSFDEDISADPRAFNESGGEAEYTKNPNPDDSTIAREGHEPEMSEKSTAPTVNQRIAQRVPEKFFIVKSLTVQDLESSVRNGIWATQNHNESALNQAYQDADNVYLIFSANKSGEFFGYARMTSAIEGEPVNLNARAGATEPTSTVTPHTIQTEESETAPKGHIIDDSARGTIFWEAELSEDEDTDELERRKIERGCETTPGSNWGRQFSIEWISTIRLPFYRTRGLRNPFNSNREVKIARDGTELEPSVGRRLVQMFHRPPPMSGPQQQPRMSYR